MKKLLFICLIIACNTAFAQDLQLTPDVYDGIPITQKQRVFVDNFDDNRYFWIKDSSPASNQIADGFYYMSNEYDFDFTDGKAIAIDFTKNFEFETDIKFVSGDVEAFNGIIWGQLVFGEKFVFSISSLGKYQFYKEDGFDKTVIKAQTTSDYLSKTDNNHLVVRKYNNKYYFFINKYLVYTTDYLNINGQYVGFIVAPNTKVRINFLKIWYIK